MNKKFIYFTITLALALTQNTFFNSANALVKPLGENNSYEEYSFFVSHKSKFSNEFTRLPQLIHSSMQSVESHNVFQAYFEYGVKETTNLAIDLKYDSFEIISKQEVEYIRACGDFDKLVQKSSQNVISKFQVVESYKKQNSHFAFSYGMILPQIYNGAIHSKTYALLLGTGYNVMLPQEIEFEIMPTAGYYPGYRKPYFENKVSFRKNIRYFGLEICLDSVANDVKIRDLSYRSALEEHLKFGGINDVLGEMIQNKILPQEKELEFINYNTVSLKVSRKIFNKAIGFIQYSKTLGDKNRFGSPAFIIGFSRKF